VYERFDVQLGRVPLLNLVEVAAISVVRVEGFAVAELGEFLRKLSLSSIDMGEVVPSCDGAVLQ
jgi:hypothetical protein